MDCLHDVASFWHEEPWAPEHARVRLKMTCLCNVPRLVLLWWRDRTASLTLACQGSTNLRAKCSHERLPV